MDVNNKRVTMAGIGSHGGAIGNARWLHDQGATLIISDQKKESELGLARTKLSDLSNIAWHIGGHREEDFTEVDLVVRNPAMPRTSPFLAAAKRANVPVTMDSALFFQRCPTPHLIGVTGSKGKTTTSSAIAHVLQNLGHVVHLIGVENTSPLGSLSKITPEDVVVFELSSWRLEALAEIQQSPSIAVVTSIYPDHLNTYDSFADYQAAKRLILAYQGGNDYALLNHDDIRLRQWPATGKGRKVWYGLDPAPEPALTYNANQATLKGSDQSESVNLSIQGPPYFVRNLLPALFISTLFGHPLTESSQHLQSFKSPAHRLERLNTPASNITFINDSAATIPQASAAALRAFSAEPLVAILGGNDKKLDFTELIETIATHPTLTGVVLLPGTATEKLKPSLPAHLNIRESSGMDEAIRYACSLITKGIVLLSPGATSFMSFKNEFDRGHAFRQAVTKYIKDDK